MQVDNIENIKFFDKDHVNISFEACLCVKKTKKHDLIPKKVIFIVINGFLLFILLNSHIMISIIEILLSKLLGVI